MITETTDWGKTNRPASTVFPQFRPISIEKIVLLLSNQGTFGL
jgi:hypothetical protein